MVDSSFREIFGFVPVGSSGESEKVLTRIRELAKAYAGAQAAFSDTIRTRQTSPCVTGPARDMARGAFRKVVAVAEGAGFNVSEEVDDYLR